MSVTQNEKAARFRALHDGPGAFVIPNPWDVGSARILAGLGFKALATSSAASVKNRPSRGDEKKPLGNQAAYSLAVERDVPAQHPLKSWVHKHIVKQSFHRCERTWTARTVWNTLRDINAFELSKRHGCVLNSVRRDHIRRIIHLEDELMIGLIPFDSQLERLTEQY